MLEYANGTMMLSGGSFTIFLEFKIIVVHPTGELYEGDFENDLRHGRGEHTFISGVTPCLCLCGFAQSG